jgi:hypothetical protein
MPETKLGLSTSEPTCETCRFWKKIGPRRDQEGKTIGTCRFWPPDNIHQHRETFADDWCGQYVVGNGAAKP